MNSRIRVELNSGNIRKYLRSAEMKALVLSRAEQIANRCGDGYEAGAKLMPSREIAFVEAQSKEARQDNLDNNTILKAVK
jgi:hypothetical protein